MLLKVQLRSITLGLYCRYQKVGEAVRKPSQCNLSVLRTREPSLVRKKANLIFVRIQTQSLLPDILSAHSLRQEELSALPLLLLDQF